MPCILHATTTADYEDLRCLRHGAYRDEMVRMFGGWPEEEQDR